MAADTVALTLGTATPGGGFPVFGEAFAATVRDIDPGLEVVCRATRGSAENVPLLLRGQLDMALVQGEAAHEAFTGPGEGGLRIVAAMYSQPGLFCVRTGTSYRSIRELVGRRVAFGVKTSGLVLLAKYVLDALDLDQQRDFDAVYPEQAGDGARMLRDGHVEALWGAGAGWPGFIEAMKPPGARLIAPDEEQIARIVRKHPFLRPITLDAFSYEGQDRPIASVGSWSMVLAGPALSEALGYRMARALHLGQPLLARRLSAARETTLANTVAVAARERLHPGVLRYLRELKLVE